ncbi:MAG TPA: NADP-dependent isocitrate dehydrogenase [Prolixibacteraceae bacterium]|nr:NADP-dependent isocitrate dehydrogenase [Bacteroidales bacterium]HRV89844.1 NADP-dependent isocitrate dehydrogenase [Prolixibacteraceae bacterium]
MGEKITMAGGKLVVPDHPVIPFIEGDGIGRDITGPSQKVLDAAVEKAYGEKRKLVWMEVLAGKKAFEQTGEYLPAPTLEAFREYLVGIKGPLETPVGGGIRSLNVALRQTLDLYVCMRPVRWFKGVPSPIRFPDRVDMHIFRENTEDIYAGIEFMAGSDKAEKLRRFMETELGVDQVRFPESSSYGVKPISREGSERLVRASIRYAIERKLPSVTLVHKGNIMKFTEGAFKNYGYDLAEREFPADTFTWRQYEKVKAEKGKAEADQLLEAAKKTHKVIIKDVITDAFLQESLLHPFDHSVIATMNLNGDYISDQLAAMVGGIGISPGANINYDSGYAIFEATHGTAPNIVGTGKANPGSLILSGVMMLEYLGWDEAAEHVYDALDHTFSKRRVTSDLHAQMEGATLLTTEEFAQEIIANMH